MPCPTHRSDFTISLASFRGAAADVNGSVEMAPKDTLREELIKPEYEPVGYPRKVQLLLQRSVRYSYRQRCCKCCPTILCEFLFPIVMILLLAVGRYGVNQLAQKLETDGTASGPGGIAERPCSQNTTVPPTTSEEIFARCFRFPPTYRGSIWDTSAAQEVSNLTNLVFQPISPDVNELVRRAGLRLAALHCGNTNVW